MPELRKDSIVERWVVFAPERANRPMDVRQNAAVTSEGIDPFAEGNESLTPGEIFAYRDRDSKPDGPGWRVRVIPNKYPALSLDDPSPVSVPGAYEALGGIGVHEVIIECPHNETNLARLSLENVREVLCVYRDRLIDLKRDSRLVHATIFKNQGVLAGASQRHAHSQLIAIPIVPMVIREELTAAQAFYQANGRSIFADLIERERAEGTRIVVESSHCVAFCPFASRFPFEVCILPTRMESHFENIRPDELADVARVLKRVLERYGQLREDPPFNYVLHTAPFNQPHLPWYAWHIEILPRVTNVAGFEWGSGMFINSVFPEDAAKILRRSDA